LLGITTRYNHSPKNIDWLQPVLTWAKTVAQQLGKSCTA